MRRAAPALALLLLLAGCSSTDATTETSSTSSSPSPSASPSASKPAFNPCSGLAAGPVGRALREKVRETTGTADNPRCAFLPVAKGGPTLNVTYLEFGGDFDKAFAAMGQIKGRVSDVRIPGATAARVVVHASRKVVLVTGFVQVHGLIETVNAIQLAPYDAGTMRDATEAVMRTLVATAP